MQRVVIIFVSFILFTISSFAQKKNKLNTPPGTVKINDTLYADETEIANIYYREFLWWLSKNDSLKYQRMLPDTSVWGVDTISHQYDSINGIEQTTYSNSGLMEYYFRHPMFNIYSAVGISYEQAVEFCKWRSDRVNELLERKPDSKRLFSKVYYRLPSKQEWEMLASPGLDSNNKYFRRRSEHVKKWTHYNTSEEIKSQISKQDPHYYRPVLYTTPVKSYFQNKYGLYQIIGNLAEMVSEKGTAKGGSFIHTLEECRINNNQYYTKPERWLGFRCVAVIIK